ncbi:type II toxin-antitoxin system HicA family toxin [Methylocystis sp. 9N]|uniref:Type II toxin-antitoxin system HicA family toxin n=1 Tax=Methylocystis borbori TaxID=3118750 RepID=A0ABU7XFN7_9HYPH
MTPWPGVKAKRLRAALERKSWSEKRSTGSHRIFAKAGFPDFIFAFHDGEEIGPRMLARIAKRTGLKPEDL